MDSELITRFDELVKRFKEEFNEIIESERAKLKAEVEVYNAEKQSERMKAVEAKKRKRSDPIDSDDDIIHLNVGGQKFTTKRSTLCQIEDSLLAAMFSGRWEDGIERDQDGCVFLDFNPQYFAFILDYLRAKKIAGPENPAAIPNVPEDQANNFNTLVEYLGLVPSRPSGIFNSHSKGVTLEEGRKTALHNRAYAQHDYVLGENVYPQAIVNLKLKLQSFHNNRWMFVGIVEAGVVIQDNYSFEWHGSYGWSLGITGQVWKAGRCTIDDTLKNLSKQGDTVQLVLDCDAAKLSLNLPTGQQFHIDIPKPQTWRLNVNFFHPNDKICIIDQ